MDFGWQRRERLFVVGVEKTLGGQFMFELLEGQLKVADAAWFQVFKNDLIGPSGFVYGQAAHTENGKADLEIELQAMGQASEDHRIQLRLAVFEREIDVTRGRRAEIGDFAADPDERHFPFEKLFYPAIELGYRKSVSRKDAFVEVFRFQC